MLPKVAGDQLAQGSQRVIRVGPLGLDLDLVILADRQFEHT